MWAEIWGSLDYALEVSDYYRDGFEAFRHRASRVYPEVDFSSFVFDDDSRSPVKAEVIQIYDDKAEVVVLLFFFFFFFFLNSFVTIFL